MKTGVPYASLKSTPVDIPALERAFARLVECWLTHPLDCRCART